MELWKVKLHLDLKVSGLLECFKHAPNGDNEFPLMFL